MRRVIITGGAGFIGLHLARVLLEAEFEVLIIDDFSRGASDTDFELVREHGKCTVWDLNLIDDSIPDFEAQVIVHLGALVGVDRVTQQPYSVLQANVEMLFRVLSWAKRVKSLEHFVFTSTSEVYAPSVQLNLSPVPTPEGGLLTMPDLRQGRSSYLLSKIYGEALCAYSNLPYTVIRPHNVYGPRMGMSHVIPQLLLKAHLAESGSQLEVASLDHTRSFMYVTDAVRRIVHLISMPATGRTLNLGNQEPEVSIKYVAETILEVVGKDLLIRKLPPTPGSPRRRCPDTSAMNNLLGAIDCVNLRDGISRTYDWYLANDERFQKIAGQ